MSFLHEPPVDRRGNRSDDLDAMLRDFFQSEMPQPWPELPLPETRHVLPLTPPPARPWVRVRSRIALAASVGLLLTGSLLLPFTVGPSENTPRGTDIGLKDGHRPIPKDHKVRTHDGKEFEQKEFLHEGKDGTEFRIELYPR
jgi:hypothetical protein